MKKSSSNSPDFRKTNAKSLMQIGNQLLSEGQFKEALFYYDQALEENQENSEIWDNRGVALSHLNLKNEAEKSFKISLQLEPDNTHAWSNMGVTLASKGKFPEAVNCFERALELDPNNDEVWNNQGTALFSQAQYQEALASFQKALELNPDNAQAWAGKGSAHRFMGNYKEAIHSLEKFIEIASADLSPQVEEAWALILELRIKLDHGKEGDEISSQK